MPDFEMIPVIDRNKVPDFIWDAIEADDPDGFANDSYVRLYYNPSDIDIEYGEYGMEGDMLSRWCESIRTWMRNNHIPVEEKQYAHILIHISW